MPTTTAPTRNLKTVIFMGHIRTASKWRWPGGVIPYDLDEDDFPPSTPPSPEEAAIAAAVNEWNSRTPYLNIRPRVDGDSNWIVFVAATENDACSSHVGKKVGAGKQEIPCNPLSNALVHEIGHAIGLIHEHQREDRDSKINVYLHNVRSDKRGNFDLRTSDGSDVGTYDFDSVMHYHPRGFAVDWPLGVPLPGQSTKAAPALAAVSAELHLVHLGESSNDIWHTWTADGVMWTSNIRVPGQTSKVSPALAAFKGVLHMVHLGGSSNDIWHSSSADFRTWTENVRTGQKSKAAPALAEFNGELHMVHIGDSSNDIWHSWTADGKTWTANVRVPGQKSKATPALAAFNGELHMVHLGDSSNDLWHSWTSDGRTWTENKRIKDQQSQAPVAMSAFNSRLHLAHVGDSSSTIWHSTFDGTEWQPNNRKDNNQSRLAPALAVFNSALHMIYRGTSDEEIRHTVRDTALVTFDGFPSETSPGSSSVPSTGDIAAVKRMYDPPPTPYVSANFGIGLANI